MPQQQLPEAFIIYTPQGDHRAHMLGAHRQDGVWMFSKWTYINQGKPLDSFLKDLMGMGMQVVDTRVLADAAAKLKIKDVEGGKLPIVVARKDIPVDVAVTAADALHESWNKQVKEKGKKK